MRVAWAGIASVAAGLSAGFGGIGARPGISWASPLSLCGLRLAGPAKGFEVIAAAQIRLELTIVEPLA
jgi:hypothetical protein